MLEMPGKLRALPSQESPVYNRPGCFPLLPSLQPAPRINLCSPTSPPPPPPPPPPPSHCYILLFSLSFTLLPLMFLHFNRCSALLLLFLVCHLSSFLLFIFLLQPLPNNKHVLPNPALLLIYSPCFSSFWHRLSISSILLFHSSALFLPKYPSSSCSVALLSPLSSFAPLILPTVLTTYVSTPPLAIYLLLAALLYSSFPLFPTKILLLPASSLPYIICFSIFLLSRSNLLHIQVYAPFLLFSHSFSCSPSINLSSFPVSSPPLCSLHSLLCYIWSFLLSPYSLPLFFIHSSFFLLLSVSPPPLASVLLLTPSSSSSSLFCCSPYISVSSRHRNLLLLRSSVPSSPSHLLASTPLYFPPPSSSFTPFCMISLLLFSSLFSSPFLLLCLPPLT